MSSLKALKSIVELDVGVGGKSDEIDFDHMDGV